MAMPEFGKKESQGCRALTAGPVIAGRQCHRNRTSGHCRSEFLWLEEACYLSMSSVSEWGGILFSSIHMD